MNALRVMTIDDEPLARERVSALVCATDGLTLVAEASNGLEALDLITKLEPDLIFLDVEMPELSGFGVLAALSGVRIPGVVFVTAYEHYALRAFEVGAIDYLHKPVTRQRFAAAVVRARERIERASTAEQRALIEGAVVAERALGPRERFVVRGGGAHRFVPVSTIDWIDVADNYLQLHAGKETHLWRGTMKEVEKELDPSRFVRIHRSILVATDRIAAIRALLSGGHVIELQNGVQLRSSRLYADRVRVLLRS